MSYIHNSTTNTSTLQSNHVITQTSHLDTSNQTFVTNAATPKTTNFTQSTKTTIATTNLQNILPEKQLTNRFAIAQINSQPNQPKTTQTSETHNNNKATPITMANVKQEPDASTILTSSNETNNTLPATQNNTAANNNDQQPTNDQTNLPIDQSNDEETQPEENQVQTNENTVIEQMAISTTITHCENNAEAEDHTQLESNQLNQHETETNTDNDEQAIRTTAGQQPNQLRRITRGIISTARQHPIAVVTGICALTVGICAGAFGIEPAVALASNQLQRILSLFTA